MMEKPLNSKHLIPESGLLGLLLILCVYPVRSQTPELEIQFASEVVNAYVDRPGDLYIQLKNDRLLKYNAKGKLIQEFKPKETPTLFEPRDGSRTFSYYRKKNLAGFTTFGLEPTTSLSEEFAVEPWLVCSAGDRNIWILDRADYSLKRVNLGLSKVEIEFRLPEEVLEVGVLHLREYQNFLFLLDARSRIFVFNGLGKLLRNFTGNNIHYFNFIGEELYYSDSGQLHFFDLLDGTLRHQPAEPSASFILLTDEARFTVYPNKVTISHTR